VLSVVVHEPEPNTWYELKLLSGSTGDYSRGHTTLLARVSRGDSGAPWTWHSCNEVFAVWFSTLGSGENRPGVAYSVEDVKATGRRFVNYLKEHNSLATIAREQWKDD
jgi:hypothetical protein